MKATKTWQVALGGVLAAGSLAVLWLACVVPSGQLGVTAVGGLYPVVKSRLEQLKSRTAEWAGKLVYFNAALTLLWFAFRELFLPALPEWMSAQAWVLYLAGNVIFILYDIALSRLIGGLNARLRPKGM